MRISDWSSDVCSSDLMLSAETAAGDWPEEAVTIMDKIAVHVEQDEGYKARVRFLETRPDPTTADALSHACMTIADTVTIRSEEHTSELQSLMRISYAVFCLKKKKNNDPSQ